MKRFLRPNDVLIFIFVCGSFYMVTYLATKNEVKEALEAMVMENVRSDVARRKVQKRGFRGSAGIEAASARN